MAGDSANLPEGIFSLLDTDLYKLTMQCCILKFFPDVSVTYGFTNRTPDKKLNRAAFRWLQAQVDSEWNLCTNLWVSY
jgi:nicotinate phosphoribosyltransferase